ncbi:MAG: hypothetical protein IJ562_05450 [Prevotella sp.]|nr:hypothetical protein [Prevotella sp.]
MEKKLYVVPALNIKLTEALQLLDGSILVDPSEEGDQTQAEGKTFIWIYMDE